MPALKVKLLVVRVSFCDVILKVKTPFDDEICWTSMLLGTPVAVTVVPEEAFVSLTVTSVEPQLLPPRLQASIVTGDD